MPLNSDLLKNILSDMCVELTEMFDLNFERKGFFGSKWQPRSPAYMRTHPKGSLLHITGKMRRSVRSQVRGTGVRFSSTLPYTELHNTGGKFTRSVKTHTRTHKKSGKSYTVKSHSRTTTMPRREFIGDHPEVQKSIREIICQNTAKYFRELAKQIKKR